MIPKNAKYRIDRGQLFKKDLLGVWEMQINSSNEDTLIKLIGDLVKRDRLVRHFDENGKDIYDSDADSYDQLKAKKESLSNLLENCQKVLILIHHNSKDLDPMFKSSLDALIDNISAELGVKKHTNKLFEKITEKNNTINDVEFKAFGLPYRQKTTESHKVVVEEDGSKEV